MNITPDTLLHLLMIWNYPIKKTTKRNALKWRYITSESDSFDEVFIKGSYVKDKSTMFKDEYSLYELTVCVNEEIVLSFKNDVSYEDITFTESLPILNGVVKDHYVPLSSIFNTFTRVI